MREELGVRVTVRGGGVTVRTEVERDTDTRPGTLTGTTEVTLEGGGVTVATAPCCGGTGALTGAPATLPRVGTTVAVEPGTVRVAVDVEVRDGGTVTLGEETLATTTAAVTTNTNSAATSLQWSRGNSLPGLRLTQD